MNNRDRPLITAANRIYQVRVESRSSPTPPLVGYLTKKKKGRGEGKKKEKSELKFNDPIPIYLKREVIRNPFSEGRLQYFGIYHISHLGSLPRRPSSEGTYSPRHAGVRPCSRHLRALSFRHTAMLGLLEAPSRVKLPRR